MLEVPKQGAASPDGASPRDALESIKVGISTLGC